MAYQQGHYKCPHCGKRTDKGDLVYVPGVRPAGCKCDPEDWAEPYNIPKVCGQFRPLSDDEPGICGDCEHNKECHATEATNA